jgi:5'-nucleotidase
MTESISLSLDSARVLLVNDDGIESPGLAVLERAVRGFTGDVWTVAPRENQSARGRAYTLRRPVDCQRLAERRFAVEGTPVDCVLVALNGLIAGRRPDLVLSGVNQGTNLGEDIPASGTVGACLEAAEQGVPGIAFSQVGAYRAADDAVWASAERPFGPVPSDTCRGCCRSWRPRSAITRWS